VTPDQIIADAEQRPLDFAPDSKFAYSNTNYTLLARIVENVSGESYADFLERHIFRPLGMKDTTLYNGEDLIPNFATGYDVGSTGLINPDYENAGWLFGCGSIVSTTHDLLLWERALMGGKVLAPGTVKRMITPYKDRYAYGVVHAPFLGYSVVTHSGFFRGFTSVMHYFPDDKLTVIVLNNMRSNATGELGNKLALLARGENVGLPPARSFARVSPAILKTYAGTYRLHGDKQVALSVDGYKLLLKTGPSTYELAAQSDTQFFIAAPDINIQIVKDDAGKTSMIYEQDGQKSKGPRLQ
jgi:CubicO group peptidase (beta-lactamase class C family)